MAVSDESCGARCPPTWHGDQRTTLSGLEPLLSIEELSEYLDVPVTTLYDWRTDGKGPCAIHVGRQLRFSVSDVHGLAGASNASRSRGACPGGR